MTTIAPQSLSGKKDSEITTYAAGTQGAGMNLTITVLPTTVSFQALEIMEERCGASAISGTSPPTLRLAMTPPMAPASGAQ